MASPIFKSRQSILKWKTFFNSTSSLFILAILVIFMTTSITEGNPVKGITSCLNNEDCLGTNRLCHRNITMKQGRCICRPGYKQAVDERIKCLNIAKRECHNKLDCDKFLPCLPVFDKQDSNHDVFTSSYYKHYRRAHGPKYCMSATMMHGYPGVLRGKHEFDSGLGDQFFRGGVEPPRTGGGLRPGSHEDQFNNQYIRVSRNNHINAGFNPEYIKFVEDCMLVLFLLCVLITLLVVHRASCARQFRRARRDGPLRYIIPHSDDQPPPYANYGPPPDGTAVSRGNTINDGEMIGGGLVTAEMMDTTDGSLSNHTRNSITMASHVQSVLGVSRKSAETPPPTYDEALAISQALSASMVTSDPYQPSLQISSDNDTNSTQPSSQSRSLYINLPSSTTNENPIPFALPTTNSNDVTNVDSTINLNTSNTANPPLGGPNERSTAEDNQSQFNTLTTLQPQQSYQPGLEVDLPLQTERK